MSGRDRESKPRCQKARERSTGRHCGCEVRRMEKFIIYKALATEFGEEPMRKKQCRNGTCKGRERPPPQCHSQCCRTASIKCGDTFEIRIRPIGKCNESN